MPDIDSLKPNINYCPATPPRFMRIMGAKQRFLVSVPTKKTVMMLGHRSGEEPTTYSGFSATTEGNVWLTACGSAAESNITLQAKGFVSIRSAEKQFEAVSKELAMLGSTTNVSVLGGNGVLIAAGSLVSPEAPKLETASSGDQAHPPQKIPAQTAALWGNIFSIVNNVVKGATASLRAFLPSALSPSKWDALGKLPPALSAIGTIWSSYQISQQASPGGVSIIADKSTLVGAAGSTSIVGGVATSVAAGGFLTLTAGGLSSLYSIGGTSVGSMNAVKVTAGKEVIVASSKKTEVAARKDELSLLGKTIQLGTKTGTPPQQNTEKIKIESTEEISHQSKKTSFKSEESFESRIEKHLLGMDKKGITLFHERLLRLCAKTISIGNKGKDTGTAEKIQIGQNNKTDIQVHGKTITLSAPNIVTKSKTLTNIKGKKIKLG